MPTQASDHPARPVIRRALERKALTLVQAEALAGFRQGQLARWLSGRRGKNGVFRDQLQRFVDVLEAPELFNVIAWRHRRWKFTCIECGAVKEYKPGEIAGWQRYDGHRYHPEAKIVDPLAGTAAYICIRCLQSAVGHRTRPYAQLRKQKGKKAVAEKVPKLMPEQRREYIERAWAANRGRSKGAEERWAHTVGHFRLRPVGRWGICRRCGYIAFSKHRRRNKKGEWVYRPVLMHQLCQDEHRRERQHAFGQPPPAPSYGRTGPQSTAEELADTFEMTVRFLRPWFPAKRRRKGASREELAQEFHLTKDGVRDRIKAFIDRLPPDDRGDKQLAIYSRALREAREKRRNSPL